MENGNENPFLDEKGRVIFEGFSLDPNYLQADTIQALHQAIDRQDSYIQAAVNRKTIDSLQRDYPDIKEQTARDLLEALKSAYWM